MVKKTDFRKINYRLATLVGCMTILCSAPNVRGQQSPPPGDQQQSRQIQVLAVVNGQQVTRQQVANECLRRFGEDVLESIIEKQLVLNECQRRGVTITEKDVNDEIVDRAKKFGMSGERWVNLICTQRDISVDHLKNDFIWNDLALRRLAAADLKVSKEELDERMEFEFGPRVQVREIAVDTKQEADQLLAQAQADPEEFGRLAKDYSVDPNSASVRGLLPPIRRNSGLPEFENVAFALQPGQISDVFQLQDKFIILKCERIFPAVELSQEQLMQTQDRLVEEISSDKLADAAAQLFKNLQNNVKVTNVMNNPELSQQMPGIAALVDNIKITKRYVAEECIARFGKGMLDTEINRSLLIQALQREKKQVDQNDINAEISLAAERFGYAKADGTADVDKWLSFVTQDDSSKIDFYIEDEVWPSVALKQLVAENVQVTNEDMQKGFEANFGPRVEVLAIVCNDNRQALKVWQMATANPDQEYFGKLANQYSIEPASKSNFGQVPPIQQHGGRPELEAEAFRLQPGEISKVVQVGEHWVIMFCQGRTTPRVTDFDAVKDELFRDIKEKKMRIAMSERFEKLRTESQIDNFLTGSSQTGAAAVQAARAQSSGDNNQSKLPFRGNK